MRQFLHSITLANGSIVGYMFDPVTKDDVAGCGTVTSVALTPPAAGITVTGSPIIDAGTFTLALANDLAALEAMSGTGLVSRTGTETYAQRTITGTANRVSVSNGDGVSANPTLDVAATYVGQTSITTLGTITTGTWHGTIVGTLYGGTGLDCSAAANGKLLIGNGSGFTLATITQGTGLTITNGAGSITAALANTAVTPGSYTLASITVDAQGRITAASNGTGGSGTSAGSNGDVQLADGSGGFTNALLSYAGGVLSINGGAIGATSTDLVLTVPGSYDAFSHFTVKFGAGGSMFTITDAGVGWVRSGGSQYGFDVSGLGSNVTLTWPSSSGTIALAGAAPPAHAASHAPGGGDTVGNTAFTSSNPGGWSGAAPTDVWAAIDRLLAVAVSPP